ncbi:MAG: AAA family ATPase [Acidocella sp.]|nr:AAA family ATPase [Acidocella sp.]
MSPTLPFDQSARAGTDVQKPVIAFLSDGASYGEPSVVVEQIETHISIVFLVGDFAYKLKRAVRYSYLDYSSVALREKYCRAELSLNRRTAPELYLRVRAITCESNGSLAFDGEGTALDWVLEMRRFDQDDLFDRLAEKKILTPSIMRDLTDTIVAFHSAAEVVSDHGGSAQTREIVINNNVNLMRSSPPLDRMKVDHVNALSMTELAAVATLLDLRKAQGKIRRCHGDLHLRNLCLIKSHPVIFDGIEFNDDFSCIDVLYDLAFLLMDLLHHGFPYLASVIFNRYLDRTGDIEGLPALPLFMSIRACVRAHVLVAQEQKHHSQQALEQANNYLTLGGQLLCAKNPSLIAIGGLSGTGKSTIAAALAPEFLPAPGARIIRSDVVRKTLFGVAPETHLPQSAYEVAVTDKVYAELYDQARQTLAAGYTAIVDATFLSESDRHEVAAVAQHAGAKFTGFWLEAPRIVLEQRLAVRHNDASDADANVLGRQEFADVGTITWKQVDAGRDIEIQLATIRQMLPDSEVSVKISPTFVSY